MNDNVDNGISCNGAMGSEPSEAMVEVARTRAVISLVAFQIEIMEDILAELEAESDSESLNDASRRLVDEVIDIAREYAPLVHMDELDIIREGWWRYVQQSDEKGLVRRRKTEEAIAALVGGWHE